MMMMMILTTLNTELLWNLISRNIGFDTAVDFMLISICYLIYEAILWRFEYYNHTVLVRYFSRWCPGIFFILFIIICIHTKFFWDPTNFGSISKLLIFDFTVDFVWIASVPGIYYFSLVYPNYWKLKWAKGGDRRPEVWRNWALIAFGYFILFFTDAPYLFLLLMWYEGYIVGFFIILAVIFYLIYTTYIYRHIVITFFLLSFLVVSPIICYMFGFFLLVPECLLILYFLILLFVAIYKSNKFLHVTFVLNFFVELLIVLCVFSVAGYFYFQSLDAIVLHNLPLYPMLAYTKHMFILQSIFCTFGLFFFIATKYIMANSSSYRAFDTYYVTLFVGFMLVGLLLIKANSTILFWFLLEALTLISYGFIAIGLAFSMRNVLTYFIFNSFAGCLVLFGILIASWDYSGNISFFLIDQSLNTILTGSVFNFGMAIVIFGFFIKLGFVPVHLWVLKVYPILRLDIFFFFLILNKLLLLILLTKILVAVEFMTMGSVDTLRICFSVLCAGSVFFGSVLAFGETDFRKFFTIVSLVQISLVGFGLSCFTKETITIAFTYSLSYFVLLLGFYCICGTYIINNMGSTSGFSLRLLFSQSWLRGLIFTFFIFAFVGLPPFLFFFIKLHLFISIYSMYYIRLFAFLVVMNGVTCMYYLLMLLVGVTDSSNRQTIFFEFDMQSIYTPDDARVYITNVTLGHVHSDVHKHFEVAINQGGLYGFVNFFTNYYSLYVTLFSTTWRSNFLSLLSITSLALTFGGCFGNFYSTGFDLLGLLV